VAALIGAALLLGLAPASRAAAGTWVVKGAGFGHGVGMSAWGAYGYGKHGARYEQILDHYFAHLKIKKRGHAPEVRVLLGTSARDVSFRRATLACGVKLKPTQSYRASRAGKGVRLLSSSGRTLKKCGRSLHAEGRGPLTIGGYGTYRGALEAVADDGGLNVVNRLRVNDYARGSVPAEVPASWPKQTLRAFAVAIRSIALSTDVGGNGYEIYADTRTQVYEGVKAEEERTNQAINATRNEVATYRGEIAQTTYFSASGGRTESRFLGGPRVPYFQSVKDPYDDYAPQHRWTFHFSQAEMDSRLGPYVDGRLRRIKVTKRGDSPRIDAANLIGSRGTTEIRGDTLAAALGLYDRWAYFKETGGRGREAADVAASPQPLPVPGGAVAPSR
jgi:stage II sporulation protein D